MYNRKPDVKPKKITKMEVRNYFFKTGKKIVRITMTHEEEWRFRQVVNIVENAIERGDFDYLPESRIQELLKGCREYMEAFRECVERDNWRTGK